MASCRQHALAAASVDVDRCYGEACAVLPPALAEPARALAFRLGLAPHIEVPWSAVFKHEVTLAAPRLLAEAVPGVTVEQIREAVTAHLLAVIEAFGSDRLADGQVARDPALEELLVALRAERDRTAAALDAGAADAFADADRDSRHAIWRERALLTARAAVSFERYQQISLAKQAVGFPASLALARAAGLEAEPRRSLCQVLAGVWLGLQHHDDVIDWEDDLDRGGAWAVCLARGLGDARAPVPWTGGVNDVRTAVLASGALTRMLSLAEAAFARAAKAAGRLGATRLAAWASEHATSMAAAACAEREHPGHAVRAHQLRGFAAEVLG